MLSEDGLQPPVTPAHRAALGDTTCSHLAGAGQSVPVDDARGGGHCAGSGSDTGLLSIQERMWLRGERQRQRGGETNGERARARG